MSNILAAPRVIDADADVDRDRQVLSRPSAARIGRSRSVVPIPIVSVDEARVRAPLMAASAAFERLRVLFGDVIMREPGGSDTVRWTTHTLAGRSYRVAQPLTFTPYASAKACSACCRFCSETLIDESASGPMSA